METRNKTFDCVEFKAEAQRRLMAEFKSRRKEFATYADFINAKAEEDPQAKAWVEKFRITREPAGR